MKKSILLGLAMLLACLTFAQSRRNTAEVFLQISNPGQFTVYLDDETVTSSKGRFRFFEVSNSAPTLSVLQNNQTIFKQRIHPVPGERLILYLSSNRLTDSRRLPIFYNGQYALDDFDRYISDGQSTSFPPSQGMPPDYNARLFSPEAFYAFMNQYKKEHFDDGRTRLINIAGKKGQFLTEQIRMMLKAFTFDDERLNMAKALYKNVADPQNYFTLANMFTFSTNKDEFLKYLETQ